MRKILIYAVLLAINAIAWGNVTLGPTPKYQWSGLSSDTKPTDSRVGTNDVFFETDTGKFFIYNGSTWSSYPIGGGGGGGGTPGGASGSIQYNNSGSFGGSLITGLVLGNGSSAPTAYAGATCTSQVVTALSASGGATCTTVSSGMVNTTIALTGVDINTSSQVTSTHLSAALPVTQGGTGVATATTHGVLIGQGTSAFHVTTAGISGQFFISNGASADPGWQTGIGITSLPAATAVASGDLFIEHSAADAQDEKATLTQIKSGLGIPAGLTTQVQFNNAGALAGNQDFLFTPSTASPTMQIGDTLGTLTGSPTIKMMTGGLTNGIYIVSDDGFMMVSAGQPGSSPPTKANFDGNASNSTMICSYAGSLGRVTCLDSGGNGDMSAWGMVDATTADTSFTSRNPGVGQNATAFIGVQTDAVQTVGNGLSAGVGCTNGAGFLDTGASAGYFGAITNAPHAPGCFVGSNGFSVAASYFVFVCGTHNACGWVDPTRNWQIGVAETGKIVNIKTDVAVDAQVNGKAIGVGLSIPFGTATFTPGTNVTSVVCATGYLCNNTRGTLTIVGGTATTGTIATVTFSAALSAAPACFVTMNGGAVAFGIGNSAPTTTAFNITAGISVVAATFNVNYICMP